MLQNPSRFATWPRQLARDFLRHRGDQAGMPSIIPAACFRVHPLGGGDCFQHDIGREQAGCSGASGVMAAQKVSLSRQAGRDQGGNALDGPDHNALVAQGTRQKPVEFGSLTARSRSCKTRPANRNLLTPSERLEGTRRNAMRSNILAEEVAARRGV